MWGWVILLPLKCEQYLIKWLTIKSLMNATSVKNKNTGTRTVLRIAQNCQLYSSIRREIIEGRTVLGYGGRESHCLHHGCLRHLKIPKASFHIKP
jgi:hypothetical protein